MYFPPTVHERRKQFSLVILSWGPTLELWVQGKLRRLETPAWGQQYATWTRSGHKRSKASCSVGLCSGGSRSRGAVRGDLSCLPQGGTARVHTRAEGLAKPTKVWPSLTALGA